MIETTPIDATPHATLLAHEVASRSRERFYRDPLTGRKVFTEFGLLERGTCCGSGCRHCPFGHAGVPDGARAVRPHAPVWLRGTVPTALTQLRRPVSVLWFHGHADDRAASHVAQSLVGEVIWLTLVQRDSQRVYSSGLELSVITALADHSRSLLLVVPFTNEAELREQALAGLETIGRAFTIKRVMLAAAPGTAAERTARSWFGSWAHNYGASLRFGTAPAA